MTQPKAALLSDRGVVRVTGEDAEKLLQGIITSDMELLATQAAIHAALLTPQGKILFEFFVARSGDGFLLETAKEQVAGLARRLALYKLRAKVDIREAGTEYAVKAIWGGSSSLGGTKHAVCFSDPRLPELGLRLLAEGGFATDIGAATSGMDVDAENYHAHRIALGVPEAGKDYVLGETFPHEANFDLLNGVSFSKGCFVGQEVVSRMQHRGTARKRIVIVEADTPLQTGDAIMAGSATIGTIGSVAGNRALALVRLDRVEEMQRKSEQITAANSPVGIQLAAYMRPAVPAGTP
jgi:folate-binding protein YgfZ